MSCTGASITNSGGLRNEAVIREESGMTEKQVPAMPRITALYSRTATFKLDEEINSILHQREVIEGYAKKNGFNNLHHFSEMISLSSIQCPFSKPIVICKIIPIIRASNGCIRVNRGSPYFY